MVIRRRQFEVVHCLCQKWEDLRRHVKRRADGDRLHSHFHGSLWILRQSEVDNFKSSVAANEDILRLDITVHQPLIVRAMKTIRYLADHGDRIFEVLFLLTHMFVEVVTFQHLHGKEENTIFFSSIPNLHDVGVGKSLEDIDLSPETVFVDIAVALVKSFKGKKSALVGFVDLDSFEDIAKPALPKGFNEIVSRKPWLAFKWVRTDAQTSEKIFHGALFSVSRVNPIPSRNGKAVPNLILVIDGDRALNEVIVDALSESGYTAHSAADMEEGLRLCGESKYDLLLMNIAGRDDIDALYRLRLLFPTPKYVGMTGYVLPERLFRAMKKEVDDWVFKPLEKEDLIRSVERTLKPFRRAETLFQLMFLLLAGLLAVLQANTF